MEKSMRSWHERAYANISRQAGASTQLIQHYHVNFMLMA